MVFFSIGAYSFCIPIRVTIFSIQKWRCTYELLNGKLYSFSGPVYKKQIATETLSTLSFEKLDNPDYEKEFELLDYKVLLQLKK